MAMTRTQLTALIREVMQATGSSQWSDATLQTWAGLAHWQEYANLLNIINSYQMQAVTVTLDLKILRLVPREDNAFGEHAKWEVLINNHAFRAGVTGV